MTALGQIGPFGLIEILGQGGMATVYLADHPEFGRVALRVIRKDTTSKSQREIVEAERNGAYQHLLLSENSCPCVPKAYQPYEDPTGSYFCAPVEYIEGETLAHRIESAPLPEAEAVRIAIAVCTNLQCSHNFKANLGNGHVVDHVVHGDIKPSNIMIDAGNQVKVLDYGISKPILDQKSATRQVFGAACYSSPERLAQKKFDLHTDLWAVGIMLYEMVSGLRPFEGNEVEVRQAFQEGRRPLPLRDVSPNYQAVVCKMLSYEKARRYPSADDLIADLRRIQNGVPPDALNETGEPGDRTVRVFFEPPDAPETLLVSDPGSLTTREPLSAAAASKAARPAAFSGSKGWRVIPLALLGSLVAAVASGGYLWWHEYRLVQEAGALSRELDRKTDISLKDWKTYENLAERSWTKIPPREPARIIRQRYKEYAARALREYREGLSGALSGQRRQTAEIYLQRALDLDPSDRQTRSMWLVVRAYGIPLANRDNGRKAIDLFEQAARIDSGAADPYLGIARVSVYTMRDPERATSAMDEANKRGYVELERDHSMLANGYYYKAIDLWKSRRRTNCDAADEDLLYRIQDLLERSIELYGGIPQFSGTQASLISAQTTLSEVKNSCRHSSWKFWKRRR